MRNYKVKFLCNGVRILKQKNTPVHSQMQTEPPLWPGQAFEFEIMTLYMTYKNKYKINQNVKYELDFGNSD